MSCYCDYDSPEFYNQKEVVAKKQHTCNECDSNIKVGETYENVFGKWNGQITTYKTCGDCLNLRFALETTSCYCLIHGSLIEDFQESIRECWKFSYSMKSMVHRKKWIEENIKEEYENWKEIAEDD